MHKIYWRVWNLFVFAILIGSKINQWLAVAMHGEAL